MSVLKIMSGVVNKAVDNDKQNRTVTLYFNVKVTASVRKDQDFTFLTPKSESLNSDWLINGKMRHASIEYMYATQDEYDALVNDAEVDGITCDYTFKVSPKNLLYLIAKLKQVRLSSKLSASDIEELGYKCDITKN